MEQEFVIQEMLVKAHFKQCLLALSAFAICAAVAVPASGQVIVETGPQHHHHHHNRHHHHPYHR
jgi:hypothetical protein